MCPYDMMHIFYRQALQVPLRRGFDLFFFLAYLVGAFILMLELGFVLAHLQFMRIEIELHCNL